MAKVLKTLKGKARELILIAVIIDVVSARSYAARLNKQAARSAD